MKRILTILCLVLFIHGILAASVTSSDLEFLLEKEQYQLIQKYAPDFITYKTSQDRNERKLLLKYAQRINDLDLAEELHYSLARDFGELEDALQWLILASSTEQDSTDMALKAAIISHSFKNPADSLVFAYYSTENEELWPQIQALPAYNDIIEEIALGTFEEISAQTDSHKAIEMIEEFYLKYPSSMWHQAAFYLHLTHLSKLKEFSEMQNVLYKYQYKSPAHAYIAALFWISPSARKEQCATQTGILNQNLVYRGMKAAFAAKTKAEAQVLYDSYPKGYWDARVQLQLAKVLYYYNVSGYESSSIPFGSLYGDEENLANLYKKPDKKLKALFKAIDAVHFDHNDKGELAEYHYWSGRINALCSQKKFQSKALEDFAQCLIYGSPRNRYDKEAISFIAAILQKQGIETDPITYIRELYGYHGITFQDTEAFSDKRYTRVALGDYDADGYIDILFNGQHLYRNTKGFTFSSVADSIFSERLRGSGGLWADFNKDGALDFVSISHDSEGKGEALMKGDGKGSFVKVNEKAGEIDNTYPTEGAAFIDIDGKGYPSLYLANYEAWQQRSGYPDNFFHNENGYFTDKSQEMGFLMPAYADNPGQAGRGVAPADFDNDGKQEILVTNYRLNRNFLYKQADSLFVDVAALYGIAGHEKKGYYGHSIGADWGDIDNDGDLDLFIANLAHPRYIDISDISMLLRNDGLTSRVVGADTLYYWLFTDITQASGITYDELHSDPLFFDADNDGYLDLFITSVYENDRSYLYRNKGDNTFTDITYLSGARMFNGWGCVAGDLDRDGLIDLVIGSGNGTKVLKNTTITQNSALYLKPILKGEQIELRPVADLNPPNTPAFGTRVKLWLQSPAGKEYTLIRELSSAKGTTSQNPQELHFGLGKSKIIRYEIWKSED